MVQTENAKNDRLVRRMGLKAITSGKLDKPIRVMIHGGEGVGKSTFAADTPSPVFLCSEDGTATLDVHRFPEPRTFEEALEALDVLELEDHKFQTAVIDTVDWLEPLIWNHVCRINGKPDLEAFGYGKGYTAALEAWRVLFHRLDVIREKRKMGVVLVGHSEVKKFQNPEGEDYDRFQIAINRRAAELAKQWVDAVLFASYEQATYKTTSGSTKGVGTGARVLRTSARPAFEAKNRYALPYELPLSWADFWTAVRKGQDPKVLEATARELAELLGLSAEVETVIGKAKGRPSVLVTIVDRLRYLEMKGTPTKQGEKDEKGTE